MVIFSSVVRFIWYVSELFRDGFLSIEEKRTSLPFPRKENEVFLYLCHGKTAAPPGLLNQNGEKAAR